MLAYLGPETILPVASILATALGFVLMFWGYVLRLVKKPFQLLFGSKAEAPSSPAPESLPSNLSAEGVSASVSNNE